MSFSENRKKFAQQTETEKVASQLEYYKEYLSKPHFDNLQRLAGKCIVHLYNDLLGKSTENNIKQFLADYYNNAEEHAKNCIAIAEKSEDLFGPKVKDWTNSSLPALDNFLLKLIYSVLNEDISKNRENKIWETDTYQHLIKKGGTYETIGQSFKAIYQLRNSFMHVQVIDDNGVRRQKPWGSKRYKKAKEQILFLYKRALVELDLLIV